ncbi:MAG: carboxypeptidase-like regulatory domain-containing protein [Paenibacillaceae bacterium]
MRLRSSLLLIASLFIVGVLTACSGNAEEKVIEFSLDQSSFPITPWKFDGSHMTSVQGKLLVNGNPVTKASVQIGNRTLETDINGSFEAQVDQSEPMKLPVSINELDQATISGERISKSDKQQILASSTQITVYYPIEISRVEPSAQGPDLVEVRGRAIVNGDASFPTFLVDRYSIMGVVKDASGEPVPNAVVNIRRSGVEGYAKSEPSNSKGEYSIYYLPEEDEETSLLVHVGDIKYELPENKIYHLPEDTSIELNITLPQEGTIIQDVPPTLVTRTAPGALYKGTLIGVKVADNISYTSTIPKQDGSFSITLPKAIWEQAPPFFETEISKFLLKPLEPGDVVPSTFIPQPGPLEPDHIIPISS